MLWQFIISFIIGLLIAKISSNTEMINPTLDNYEGLMFIDESNVCYRYKPIEVDC